ncbi:MAG: ATP-binding protein, partial [Acidobacteriota bacterium]
HEIRSPLARLGVATDLARRRPDRVPEALDRIDKESRRLDRLIGEVLTLARLEGDVPTPLDDYFDLIELLRVIRDDIAFEADSVGLDVAFHVPDRGELVIRGNAELLHRAVENVVRNAFQHSTGAGRIEIHLELADGASGDESDGALIRVRDDGAGLSGDELEALFEPFQRGQSSSGFGLGLAIARRAVDVHRGSIRAVDAPGGGVEVQIRLPIEGP